MPIELGLPQTSPSQARPGTKENDPTQPITPTTSIVDSMPFSQSDAVRKRWTSSTTESERARTDRAEALRLPIVNESEEICHVAEEKEKCCTALLEPDAFRLQSIDLANPLSESRLRSPSPPRQAPSWTTSASKWPLRVWSEYSSSLLVIISSFFGALMNLCARLLELEDGGMNLFQILFARMIISLVVSAIYLYWQRIPDGVLGANAIRWLLVLRGITGFFGIFGMWFSIRYLPLADATVITFLVPPVSGLLCYYFLHDPYTRKEQIASIIALAGVVLLARPASIFGSTPPRADVPSNIGQAGSPSDENEPTPVQRLWAVGCAMIGVLGGAGAFTAIRCIGKRAHPLTPTNYFSLWTAIVSGGVLALAPVFNYEQPQVHFDIPHSLRQWMLLLGTVACGFLLQLLLTMGLRGDKTNRAALMSYTGMLWAAGFDKWVFGHEMGRMSLMGCVLIVGSALWVVVSKSEASPKDCRNDIESVGSEDEIETDSLLGSTDVEDEESLEKR